MSPVRFVAPPESTTLVRSRARRSRCSASVRVRPHDVTVASTGSRSGVDDVAGAQAGVHPHPGADRERHDLDAAAGGGVPAVRVVGEQPGLDGPSLALRLGGRQRAAQVGPQAHAEDAGAGAFLDPGVGGPAVGVDLGDGEGAVGVEGEVDHGTAAVPRLLEQRGRRRLHRRRGVVGHAGGRQLGEHRPGVTHDGDLAQPERPHRAVRVAHGVDLEPARPLGHGPGRPQRHPGGGGDLGQPRRRAEGADGGRVRAEDEQPGPGAGVGRARPGRRRAPARATRRRPGPRAARPRRRPRAASPPSGSVEHHGLGGLPSPPGPAPRHGAHRDGAQPLAADRVGERAGGREDPQRGLATVDDGEPSHTPHAGVPVPRADSRPARTSSGTPPGSGTVV